jgi:Phage major capsid protein E
MLDIFKGDAFSVFSLTDRINQLPFIPGRAGTVIDWNEGGVSTLSVGVESISGVLRLIDPSPRGSPGQTTPKNRRNLRMLRIPHYQIDDAVYADEVQGIRAFGSETVLQTVMGKVDERMSEHVQLEFDPTLEYQRIGALKGIILNADGSTLYNLFTEFDVDPLADVVFDFDAATPSPGAIRTACAEIARSIARAMGGLPYGHLHAFCGDSFYDQLIASEETRETYEFQQAASQLRAPSAFTVLQFAEITFENYRGGIGAEEVTPFIATDECQIFPVGVPGLFRTLYAPADYIETVNTIGLPRYSKQYPMDNGKGIHMEMQTNALSYCTRPRVLVKGKANT